MAGTVYSYLLFKQYAPIGETYTYSPPTGFKWVIRDIVAWNQEGTPLQAMEGWQMFDDVSAPIMVVGPDIARAAVAFHWSGRENVEQDELLTVQSFDNGWAWRASGFQLSLP